MMILLDKTIQYPIDQVEDNLISLDDGEIWGVYRVQYDYLKINDYEQYADYISKVAEFLKIKGYKYQINLIPRAFDFDVHMQKTIDNYVKGDLEEEGKYYFKRASNILKEEAHVFEYDIVLQVQLNISDKELPDNFIDYASKLSSRVVEDINKFIFRKTTENSQLKNAKSEEKNYLLTATSYIGLEPCTQSQINRYLYYDFHRNEGIIDNDVTDYKVTEGILQNHKGYITIEHENHTDYVAFLPFVKMPAKLYAFKFIDSLKSSFTFPIDFKINIDFKEKQNNIRTVRKFKKRLQWFDLEIQNDTQLDEDEVVTMASQRLETLIDDIKTDNTELLYVSMMLSVYATSKNELEKRIKEIENSIESTQFEVERPSVDQMTLFHKSILCSNVQYNYFEQVCDPTFLGQSGFNLTHKIGNNYGFPMGQIVTNCGVTDVEQATFKNKGIVFSNPLLTKLNIPGALHTNGNMLISGPPGSGKSVGVKNKFTWSSFFGAKSLYIDPKNEYRRNFEKAVEKYGETNPMLKSMYEKMNFIHLSDDEIYRGALDPLIFLEGETAIATAKQVLMGLGNVTDSRKEVNIITSCIKEEVRKEDFPTLTGVLQRIHEIKDETLKQDAKEIAEYIGNYNTGLGKMLFGTKESNTLNFDNQITVLGIQGLTLPKDSNIKVLTDDERISIAIMTSISKYIHIFSTDINEDALMIVDEAWIFKASSVGEELINEMLRTGRSLKTDVWLVTQAFDDYNTPTFRELIGCKMAYRPKSDKAVDDLLEFFGISENNANRKVVKDLKAGICLFEDYNGRVEVIANDIMFDEWFVAFKTTDKENNMLKTELEYYS